MIELKPRLRRARALATELRNLLEEIDTDYRHPPEGTTPTDYDIELDEETVYDNIAGVSETESWLDEMNLGD